MGFVYFDTTQNNIKETAAISIQKLWKRKNVKIKQEMDASNNWWKENRDSEYYYLFIENSNFYIEELYNRLLTIIIPGIDYICIKKKDTFPKCILIKTNLHKYLYRLRR